MADCAGVRPHIVLRGTSYQRFGQPSWCNPGDRWLRRLVSPWVARGEARTRICLGEGHTCDYPPAASGSRRMDDTGTSPGATTSRDLSDFGRGKGWPGWKCCDGSLGRDLRNYQRPWNMVSDPSAVCWIIPGKNHHRTNRRLSL